MVTSFSSFDSLATINVSQSETGGKNNSYSLGNTKLFETIKGLGEASTTVKYEKKEVNNGEDNEKPTRSIKKALFIVICVSNEYLLDCLVSGLGQEKFEDKKHRDDKKDYELNKEKVCARCNKTYSDKDNNSYEACHYHFDYVYDQSLDKNEWKLYRFRDYEDLIKTMESKKDKKSDLNNSPGEDDFTLDTNENRENLWKFICCNNKYDSQGCKNNKHTDNADEWEEMIRSKLKEFNKKLKK